MMMTTNALPQAKIVLADGTQYTGLAFGSRTSTDGEVVFTTGMVGYPESLTDPSYRGQLLVTTYPLAGNYGVPVAEDPMDPLKSPFESYEIHARALIVTQVSHDYSHFTARQNLDEWLKKSNVVGLTGIDTRALTKKLRHVGSMPGKILVQGCEKSTEIESAPFVDVNDTNLVAEVSCKEPQTYGDGKTRIILVDCGAKFNIIRSLVRRGVSVRRVPWDFDFTQEDGDGVLISNGPGNPKMVETTIGYIRQALSQPRPLFGICLGNQLTALAAGANTFKMPFGHRSQNQPCVEVGTQRCIITSQNHGFAVDGRSLPEDWQEWYINANDQTNEGIKHTSKPYWTVQFHPEATPGPVDAAFLFDDFIGALS